MPDWKPPFADDHKVLIDLYKYYEGVGTQARAQMITTANWILGFAVALLVYAVRNVVEVTPEWAVCARPSFLGVTAPATGIVLCALALVLVGDFYDHVTRNWLRATRCKSLVRDLFRIVDETGEDPPVISGGWPEYLETAEAFRKPRKGETRPRSRVRVLFVLYMGAAWVLLGLFVLALLLPRVWPCDAA